MSIHQAARNCNVSQLRRALAAGASPNIRDGFGRVAAIHLLCKPPADEFDLGARLACLDLLRQSPDFDVNLTDEPGDRAIHYLACHAKSRDDVDFMQAVVDAGADVNAKAESRKATALHWAIQGGGPISAAKIDMLIRAGASVTAREEDGDTPLDCAVSEIKAGLTDRSHVSQRMRFDRNSLEFDVNAAPGTSPGSTLATESNLGTSAGSISTKKVDPWDSGTCRESLCVYVCLHAIL